MFGLSVSWFGGQVTCQFCCREESACFHHISLGKQIYDLHIRSKVYQGIKSRVAETTLLLGKAELLSLVRSAVHMRQQLLQSLQYFYCWIFPWQAKIAMLRNCSSSVYLRLAVQLGSKKQGLTCCHLNHEAGLSKAIAFNPDYGLLPYVQQGELLCLP